jgi:hypothetical protein
MGKKPHVTELLELLNKPALMNWSNKIGLQGITLADFRKEALRKGSSIHRQIECYVLDKIPFEKEENQLRFIEFMQDKKILEIEKVIETEWFTGRCDCIIEFNGKTYLCDFKSQDGVYFENILQLVAYRMAIKTDHIAVIGVPKFKFRPIYSIQDYTPYEEILKALSHIYNLKKYTNEYF